MAVPQNQKRVAKFGVFELDLSAGELRKSGVKLRLQGQPFQVLALLLERAGEVVTREELQQKLWPADTFVDLTTALIPRSIKFERCWEIQPRVRAMWKRWRGADTVLSHPCKIRSRAD